MSETQNEWSKRSAACYCLRGKSGEKPDPTASLPFQNIQRFPPETIKPIAISAKCLSYGGLGRPPHKSGVRFGLDAFGIRELCKMARLSFFAPMKT